MSNRKKGRKSIARAFAEIFPPSIIEDVFIEIMEFNQLIFKEAKRLVAKKYNSKRPEKVVRHGKPFTKEQLKYIKEG